MNNAEIAKRLDGMECKDVTLRNVGDKWVNLYQQNQGEPDDEISFIPPTFLPTATPLWSG